jgi:ABC-2 type transport system permease protein
MTGVWVLTRLGLRRDRVMLPVWLAALILSAASSASATAKIYPTLTSRLAAAANANGAPALVALYGRIYDPSSLGALAIWKMSAFGAAAVGVLAILSVVRHTRADEETGRLELIGATAVGRFAPLAAALIIALATNVVLAIGAALGTAAAGLPVDGSIAFGLAWGMTGLAFAGVAAVTAQLASTARGATSTAMGVLGLAYLIRAVGDASTARWLSWFSPIGWSQQVRPYAGNQWWVLIMPAVFAVAGTGLAFALSRRRDLGAGFLPDRPGPAEGDGLRSPEALAWRLQRGLLLGWVIAFVVLGGVVGSLASNLSGFLDSPEAQKFITELGGKKALTDAFLATELSFTGVIASIYGVQAVLRLHAEESLGRAEPLLATAVSRFRYAGSHVLVALGGTALLCVIGGAAAGAANAATSHDWHQFGRVLAAGVVQIPAAWVITAAALAFFGLWSHAANAGWAVFGGALLLGTFGPVFNLNQRLMNLSPFAHTPKLPGVALSPTPILWLLAVAAALLAVGFAGFRRRDLVA